MLAGCFALESYYYGTSFTGDHAPTGGVDNPILPPQGRVTFGGGNRHIVGPNKIAKTTEVETMGKLQGKVALATATARGIGEGVCYLAALHMNVMRQGLR